ncbi:FG-GAP-like repeat-containing protein [Propionibacteriaceae bacterium G57]|uniref:FG-GAP-like repeat-containing protein n=1 Tax=Aestuariimicrobium sp. G57 TaxID=3418485 RepID=UPI003DA711A1
MRSPIRLAGSLLLGLLVALTPLTAQAKVLPTATVSIPDANFRACLNAALGQSPGAAIQDTQLATITNLDCSSRPIANLTGWHHLVNVQVFTGHHMALAGSVSVPAQLTKLININLSFNQVTAASFPAALSQVADVDLRNNRLTTFALPNTLTNIQHVYLQNNRLQHLGGLSWMPNTSYVNAASQQVVLPNAYIGVPYTLTMRDHRNQPVQVTLQPGVTYNGTTLQYGSLGSHTMNFANPPGSFTWGQFSGTFTQQVTQPPATGKLGDQTGDGIGDLFGIFPDGQLRATMGSTTNPPTFLGFRGTGWGTMTYLVQINDITGDNRSDLMARRGTDQSLWVYRQIGGGYVSGWKKMGQNWGGMDQIVPAFNLAGGSTQYVVARRASDGKLFRYTLTSNGLTGIVQIGQHWNGMKQILSVGDFNGDGRSDVLAIRNDGTLWRYLGTAQGSIGSGTQVGHGWTTFRLAFCAGDWSGDGRYDLMGLRNDGALFTYQKKMGTWGPARPLGTISTTIKLIA